MISFERFTLPNGLKLLVHEDKDTPMVVVNTMYNIGSKHEDPAKTGFAHLFEHLMFGGSENVEKFDYKIEQAGGYSNAYTSNDITNYYDQVTANNLDTVLWLESDRMNQLRFDTTRLENQQKVVKEEYKQSYLNQPYGDVWIHMFPLIFSENNLYGWPTIGKTLEHIEDATLDYVKEFFYTYYRPENAILSIAGNINAEEVRNRVEKWYGDIKQSEFKRPKPVKLNVLNEVRKKEHHAKVPSDLLVLAFQGEPRSSKNHQVFRILEKLMSGDKSTPLYQILVKDKEICSDLGAGYFSLIDQGVFYLFAYANEGVDLKTVEEEVWQLLETPSSFIDDKSLLKVKNNTARSHEYGYIELQDRAEDLAYFELLGDAEDINKELDKILAVTTEQTLGASEKLFTKNAHAVLYYKKQS